MAKRTALVVEDQENFREFLTIALDRLGFEVVTALTGKVALKRVEEHRFKLVILDLMLPDMDGFAICRALREHDRTHRVPIIFCTAVGTEKTRMQAMDVGATDFLVKPIGIEELREVVNQYVPLDDE